MKRLSLAHLIALLAALLIAFAPLPTRSQPTERVVRVEAGNSTFTPAVIHANPGDRITLELVSLDVVHGIAIDGYPVNFQADPGQTARASFVAERAGTYKLRCSVACGNLHPFMTGKLVVGQNLLLYRAGGIAFLILAVGAWQAFSANKVTR